MFRSCRLVPAMLLLLHPTPSPALPENFAGLLSFEPTRDGEKLAGWNGQPSETASLDSTTVHSGRYAGLLVRGPASPSKFSNFNTKIPADFSGHRLELHGWLRTENVSGFAGLWLREDGKDGMLHLDNMEGQRLSGTTGWTEYSIVLPIDPEARSIVFGALLSGQGRVWVDDLWLLVDGRPVAEAPARVRQPTAADADHEFDAGSGVAAIELTPQQVANLVTLGKTWGFLKSAYALRSSTHYRLWSGRGCRLSRRASLTRLALPQAAGGHPGRAAGLGTRKDEAACQGPSPDCWPPLGLQIRGHHMLWSLERSASALPQIPPPARHGSDPALGLRTIPGLAATPTGA